MALIQPFLTPPPDLLVAVGGGSAIDAAKAAHLPTLSLGMGVGRSRIAGEYRARNPFSLGSLTSINK